jgi:cytochrome P450
VTAATASRTFEDLPGPAGLPVLGNALDLKPGRFHHVLESWARTYGDVYRFRMGARRVMAVADPQVINALLRDRPDGFLRTSRLVEIGREVGLTGVFFANGDEWRRQRRMVMSAFDPGHVKRYFPALVDVTQRLRRRWIAAAERGDTIRLQSDLMRYTVDVTAGLAFGTDINTLEAKSDVIQQHLDQVLPMVSKRLIAPFRYWRVLKLPADRRFDRHLREIHRAIGGFIAQARSRLEADPSLRERPGNLIEAMIVARDAGDSGLTDADVAGNVFTMLLAGEDTTANTLAWMIWLLSCNEPARRRAQAEVLEALGDDPTPTRIEQTAALPYLEACVNETMRIKPVAPIIFVQAGRDANVGGVAILRGTILALIMRAGTTSERFFPDPEAFEPERWLGQDEATADASPGRRVSMPFGAGPRLCPGRYLALQEIKMVMAMLLAGFDILSVASADAGEVRERLDFTMAPVPLLLRVAPRA